MSSYFDDRSRDVRDADNLCEKGAEFLRALCEIEERVFRDVAYITGDREFPEEFRETAMGIVAVHGVFNPSGVDNHKAEKRALMVRSSRMIEDLHSLFHDVARSRTETRFGLLSDSPTGDGSRRDAHDVEHWADNVNPNE